MEPWSRRRCRWFACTILALALAAALAVPGAPAARAEPAAPAPGSALLENGKFQDLKPQMSRLIELALDGPAVKLDRDAWEEHKKKGDKKEKDDDKQKPKAGAARIRMGIGAGGIRIVGGGFGLGGDESPVEKIFQQIQAAAGSNGISTSDTGERRSASFEGQCLSGLLEVASESVTVRLTETAAPGRAMELFDDGRKALRLSITEPDGDMVMLSQSRKGVVTAVAIVNGEPWAASAPSFAQLYRQHRAALDAKVFPVLRHMGVKLMISPDSTEVRQAVLAALRPLSEQEATQGRKLLADLDNEDFAAREAATKNLTEQYGRYKGLIQEHLKNPALTAEGKTRLEKVLAAHPNEAKVAQLIASMDLLSDPTFLVSLLDGAGDRSHVVERLEKVTGQKFGADAGAWRKWLAEKR